MTKCRGMRFRDEDDAYDYFRQREVDDAAEALRAHEEAAAKRQPAPLPQSCHACEHKYAGAVCPICKTERPAYTALKNITESNAAGQVSPKTPVAGNGAACPPSAQAALVECRYYHGQPCDCGGRGVCIPAA